MYRSEAASLPFVVSQLADNCGWLWERREQAAHSLFGDPTRRHLEELDDRLDTHVDALRVCGGGAREAALEALGTPDAGGVFTAAALVAGRPAARDLDAFTTLVTNVRGSRWAIRPFAVALHWIDERAFAHATRSLAEHDDAVIRAIVVTAAAMRHIDCEDGITAALLDDSACVIEAGCAAAARIGMRSALPLIEEHCAARDGAVAVAAGTAAMRLGSSAPRHTLATLASEERDSPIAEAAARSLFQSLPPAHSPSVHRELFAARPASRAALKAAGAAGARDLVPFVLDHIEDDSLASIAASEFAAITGYDLAPDPVPAGVPRDAGDDAADDIDAEEIDERTRRAACPIDPRRLAAWWHRHADQFRSSMRYLDGAVATDEVLQRAIACGRQAARLSAADLYAGRGHHWVDVCAPSFRQSHVVEARWR